MYNYVKYWRTKMAFRKLGVVNLQSLNEGLEDFNEAMEWDAEDRVYEFNMELTEELDAQYLCENDNLTSADDWCFGYFGAWVHHCPDCGGPVTLDA